MCGKTHGLPAQMESVSARVNIVTSQASTSTVVSISQPYMSPFIEGDNDEYEFEVPERNDPVNDVILARAEENKRRVAIRPSRLMKLQQLEQDLPAIIENALQEIKRQKLAALHKKDKQDPEKVNMRAKRYADSHREEINARRREKRKQLTAVPLQTVPSSLPLPLPLPLRLPTVPSLMPSAKEDKKMDTVDGGVIVSFGL
jgi:hypothetical protein